MADELRQRLHARVAYLRSLFARAARNPDLLRRAVEDAVQASSFDPPAQLRDPLEHALGGTKRVLQDLHDQMRKGVLGLPLLLTFRLRERTQRIRSQTSSALSGSGSALGAGALNLLTVASAAVLIVAGQLGNPPDRAELLERKPAAQVNMSAAAGDVARTAPAIGLGGLPHAGSGLAISTNSLVSEGLPSQPRARANVRTSDDEIEIARDVVVRIGDEDYPIWTGRHFTLSCRPATTARSTTCNGYRTIEPTAQSVMDG